MATTATKATASKKKSTTKKSVDKPAKPSKRGARSKRAGKKHQPVEQQKERLEHLRPRTFPVVRETITLDHAITRGAFDKYFDGLRGAFFHSTSLLGKHGIPNGADRIHGYIIDLIDKAGEEIKSETARIGKLIEQETGKKTIPKSSPEVEQRTAEVPSFVVRK